MLSGFGPQGGAGCSPAAVLRMLWAPVQAVVPLVMIAPQQGDSYAEVRRQLTATADSTCVLQVTSVWKREVPHGNESQRESGAPMAEPHGCSPTPDASQHVSSMPCTRAAHRDSVSMCTSALHILGFGPGEI